MNLGSAVLLGAAPSIWLTPVWILGLGAVAGLVLLFLSWGVLFGISRRAAGAVPLAIREGVLWPVFLVVVFLAVTFFGFVVLLSARYKRCASNEILVIYGKAGGTQPAPAR